MGRSGLLRAIVLASCGVAAATACSDLLGIHGDRPLATSDAATPNDAAEGGLRVDTDLANQRADDAVQSMMLRFWNRSALTEIDGQIASPASVAQAWHVVVDAASRHDGARFLGTLQALHDEQRRIGFSFDRYDEEALVAIVLLRAYDLTGDGSYLLEARTIFQDIVTAWDTTCCTSIPSGVPGGIWHDRGHLRKSTAANAAAIIAGARLYERTQLSSYLSFAKQLYAYWSANMIDETSHQVWDGISTSGFERAKHIDNQGLMLGAALAIGRASVSADNEPLSRAHDLASFMLREQVAPSPLGPVLSDDDDGICVDECARARGTAARYLGELYAANPAHPEYLEVLLSSAESAWSVARDASSGVFGPDWRSPPASAPLLGATSSAASLFSAVAAIGGVPPDPTGGYEAEEGRLHALSLATTDGGYSGWGYVTGWGCDTSPAQDPVNCKSQDVNGQTVGLPVNVALPGEYDLTFRYSASATPRDGGAANASRRLVVNDGAFVIDDAPFAPPPPGAQWAEHIVPGVPLRPGMNAVSLAFDAARGSYGRLSLDRLTIPECPTRAAPNLLPAQPRPEDWFRTFDRFMTVSVSRFICGQPVIQWRGAKIPRRNWMKIYPHRAPFGITLVPGTTYVASLVMSGSGIYHIDVWDGGGGNPDGGPGGKGDNFGPSVTMTRAPQELSVVFAMGFAEEPQIQVRIDGPGSEVDVDVEVWNVGLRPL